MGQPIRVCNDFSQGDGFIIKVSHNPIVDLTGAVFSLILKKHEDGASALQVDFNVPVGADATNGIVNILIPSSATAPLQPGKYFGALKRTLAGGDPLTIVRTNKDGAIKVTCFANLKV